MSVTTQCLKKAFHKSDICHCYGVQTGHDSYYACAKGNTRSPRKAVKGEKDVVHVKGGHRTKVTTTQLGFLPFGSEAREPDGCLRLFKAHFVRTEVCDNVNEDGQGLLALKLVQSEWKSSHCCQDESHDRTWVSVVESSSACCGTAT